MVEAKEIVNSYKNLESEEKKAVLKSILQSDTKITRDVLEDLADQSPSAYVYHVPQLDKTTKFKTNEDFQKGLEKIIGIAQKNDVPLSVVYIDIDNFKKINDEYGHPIGTEVVRNFSAILWSSIRHGIEESQGKVVRKAPGQQDLVARINNYDASFGRMGGDEFAVALYGCDAKEAELVVRRFQERLKKEKLSEKQDIKLTLSVGIAEYVLRISGQELINRADKAMYHAKKSGKNSIGIY